MIIAFMVAAVSSGFRIHSYVDRACRSFCTGDTYDKYFLPVELLYLHHTVGDNVGTDFLAVIDHIPEIFLQFLSIDLFRHKSPVFLFAHTEQDYSAIGIGKSRVGFPE